MPTLVDEISHDALFCMFKGEPGTRKSTQALSFPRPQYWISTDKKMNSILIPANKWNIPMKEIVYDDYDDWDKPRRMLETFLNRCPYKTVIVDSVTSLADGALRQTRKLKGGEAKKVGTIAVNSIEDYNAEDAALSEMLALLKDVHYNHKVNIIIIAHVLVAEYRDMVKKETHVSRTIVTAGKRIALKLPAYCEEVYHFNVGQAIDVAKGGGYEALTQHTGDDFARTTLPLDRVIKFGDKPIYETYIVPAREQLKQQLNKQQETTK